MRRGRASTSPARPAPSEPSVEGIDERVGAIVEAVARVARDPGSPAGRLEGALEILLDAYADERSGLSARCSRGGFGRSATSSIA